MVQKTLRHHQAFCFPTEWSALPLKAKCPETLQKGGEMPPPPQQWGMWCTFSTRPSPVPWVETPRNPPADSAGTGSMCLADHSAPATSCPASVKLRAPLGSPKRLRAPLGSPESPEAPCLWAARGGLVGPGTMDAQASEEHRAGLIYFQHCSFSLHLRGETHITGSHFHDFVAIRISWIRVWFIRTPCGCEEVSSQGQCGVNYILSTPPLLIAGYKKYKRKKKLQMWNIWMNSLRQQRDLQISPSDVYTSTLCSFKTRNLY